MKKIIFFSAALVSLGGWMAGGTAPLTAPLPLPPQQAPVLSPLPRSGPATAPQASFSSPERSRAFLILLKSLPAPIPLSQNLIKRDSSRKIIQSHS